MAERKAEAESQQLEAEARQREAASSFENIARKWWEWWSPGKSPRHADYVLRRLEADVFPALGHKYIDDVAAADIRELMLAIESRGARDVAKRSTRPQAKFSAVQLPAVSPRGILRLISSRATFSRKPAQRTLLAWMPKTCPPCWLRWRPTTEMLLHGLPCDSWPIPSCARPNLSSPNGRSLTWTMHVGTFRPSA